MVIGVVMNSISELIMLEVIVVVGDICSVCIVWFGRKNVVMYIEIELLSLVKVLRMVNFRCVVSVVLSVFCGLVWLGVVLWWLSVFFSWWWISMLVGVVKMFSRNGSC